MRRDSEVKNQKLGLPANINNTQDIASTACKNDRAKAMSVLDESLTIFRELGRDSSSTGMMLTPLFLGWMFDKTGSYTSSLLTLAALYGASALLFGISRPPRIASSQQS